MSHTLKCPVCGKDMYVTKSILTGRGFRCDYCNVEGFCKEEKGKLDDFILVSFSRGEDEDFYEAVAVEGNEGLRVYVGLEDPFYYDIDREPGSEKEWSIDELEKLAAKAYVDYSDIAEQYSNRAKIAAFDRRKEELKKR